MLVKLASGSDLVCEELHKCLTEIAHNLLDFNFIVCITKLIGSQTVASLDQLVLFEHHQIFRICTITEVAAKVRRANSDLFFATAFDSETFQLHDKTTATFVPLNYFISFLMSRIHLSPVHLPGWWRKNSISLDIFNFHNAPLALVSKYTI